MSRLSSLRITLALAFALVLLFLALWIEIPAPTYDFLTLTVAAPEMSAWLVVLALVPVLVAVLDRRRHPTLARLTSLVALAAMVLPARVLLRIPGTIRTFDAAMASTLGADYLSRVPADVLGRMRRHPVNIGPLFTGLGHLDARVSRGVVYATPEGQPLTLDIYRPQFDAPAPIVIQTYGGAWQRGAPDDDATVTMSLAARGYVVLAIDYRHAPRWRWPAQLDDVRSAIQWARDHGAEFGGDPHRIATLGRSSGAQLAFIAGVTAGTPDLRAIVLYYSPVDLTDGYRNPGKPDTLNLRVVEEALLGGTPDTVPEAYRNASPIEYAGRAHPPVLLIDGGQDHIVKASFGQVFADKLRSAGTCVFMVIPWADHAFDAVPFGPSAQIASYYTERFLAWAMLNR